jgi:hypothetical protein
MAKVFLSKIFHKLPKVWIITFFLSTVFLILAVPYNAIRAQEASSAGSLYLFHMGTKNDQSGFIPELLIASRKAIEGEATPVTDATTGMTQYKYQGGAVQALASYADATYENPAGSSIIWAQDQINLIAGKGQFQALAGDPNSTDFYYVSGFTALEPIRGMWNWSANIVYALFIVILIGISFMILFRQSLGGQQYVTLANSLPSVVLSLVLIFFSYPISAVFIDAVSIGTNLVYNIMVTASNAPGNALITQKIMVPKAVETTVSVTEKVNQTPTTVNKAGFEYKDGEVTEIKNVLQPDDPQMSIWSIFYTSNAKICGGMPFGVDKGSFIQPTKSSGENCEFGKYLVPAGIYGPFGSMIQTVLNTVGDTVSNPLIELIIGLAIITTQFKLLKRIFTDYMVLSFFPIISPWIFLMAAMPNRTNKTISDFLRILGGAAMNLVILYACFLFLVILGYATNDGTKTATGSSFQLGSSFKQASEIQWLPPMLGYSYGQIIGNSNTSSSNTKIITTIVIVMFYMAIPRIPDEIQSWLQVPELPAVVKGAGQDLAAKGRQVVGGAAGVVGNIAQQKLKKDG